MARGRKKSETSKSELIHIRLDEELLKSLENFCKISNVNRSEGVRLIMETVLK